MDETAYPSFLTLVRHSAQLAADNRRAGGAFGARFQGDELDALFSATLRRDWREVTDIVRRWAQPEPRPNDALHRVDPGPEATEIARQMCRQLPSETASGGFSEPPPLLDRLLTACRARRIEQSASRYSGVRRLA